MAEECLECGSNNINREIGEGFKDWVCQDCGLTVVGGQIVEEQQGQENKGISEEL